MTAVVMMLTNFSVTIPIMMVPFEFSMAFFPIPVVLIIMMPVVNIPAGMSLAVMFPGFIMPVVNIPVRMSLPIMFPGFIMPVLLVMMILFHLIITMPFAMRFMRTSVPVMGK